VNETKEILESLMRQVGLAKEFNNSNNEQRDAYIIGYDHALNRMARMIQRRLDRLEKSEGR